MVPVEAHKKFGSFEEASKYAKRLRNAVNYICNRNGYQASVMTLLVIQKKVSDLRYISNGKIVKKTYGLKRLVNY